MITVNPSNTFITALKSKLENINTPTGSTFVGLTYTAKGTGETARYVVNMGVSYKNTVTKSFKSLEEVEVENLSGLEVEALAEVKASLQNTLDNMEKGLTNDNYTKAATYVAIYDGLKVNVNDGTFEVNGMIVSKKVLVEGVYKKVNSRPLTIAKEKLKKNLPVSKYRSFCLDNDCLDTIRIGGCELEVL